MGSDDSPERTKAISLKENTTQERSTNIATFTTKDGARFEAPADSEGYAYLERMFAMSLAGVVPA